MNTFASKINVGIMMWLAVFFLGGCGATPRLHQADVSVILDEQLHRTTSLTVDLVGVNPEDPLLKSVTVDEWFSVDSTSLREDTPTYEMDFSPAGPRTQQLSKSDPIWAEWRRRGARELMVLVDLLPGAPAGSGATDARRKIIPFTTDRWSGLPDQVRIQVKNSRIELLTPPKPPKN